MTTPARESLQSLLRTAKRGSAERFFSAYDPAVIADPETGMDLLWNALLNKDGDARTAITTRLLNDGVDPGRDRRGTTAAHVLLDGNRHVPHAEAPLLLMMLDYGADVNAVDPKVGTPLETIAARFKFTDEELTPFYDVILGRSDLDLLKASISGNTVLANLRKWSDQRAELIERAEAYLHARGVTVPGT